MNKILPVVLLLVIAAGLIMGSCAQPSPPPTPASSPAATPAPPPSWPKVTFITPPSGRPPHTLAVAWSTLAAKYLPGMQIIVEPASGMPVAIQGLLQGAGDICYSTQSALGTELPKFLGGKRLANGPQHLLASPQGSAFHVLTRAGSGITSVADFKGKKILGKVAGGAGVDVTRQEILAAYGMKDDDIILLSGNNGAHLAEQFREGIGDAAIIPLPLGDVALVDLCTVKDIQWISLPQDKMMPIAERNWMSAALIPAGTYPKQDKAVPALLSMASFDANPTMSIDVAYALVKLYHEHFDELSKMAPFARDFTVKSTVANMYLPVHPGAIKYLKENGVWSSDAEAKQQQLLNRQIPGTPAK